MSSDPVGGYILFPSTLSRGNLISITLQAMELVTEGFEVLLPGQENFPLFANDGFPVRPAHPPEQAVALLTQAESGVIEGQASKSSETYWFEPPLASYPTVLMWVYDRSLYADERVEEAEDFVRRWLQLCEQGQAVFGYFSPFSHMFDRDFLEEKILPAVQTKNLDYPLNTESIWLIYLGPELAEQWRAENAPLPSPCLLSQDLPSGAHFFRTTTNVMG